VPTADVEHRLTTILAADVAGYSRLIEIDEEGTIKRLRILARDLIDPTIAAHHGRVVKRTGDGMLIEFASVVDAVRCALAAQYAMAEENRGLQGDQRIAFRIGIDLGDVVVELDGDLMGDGVNIAARLEDIATPGGICLSHAAYDQIRGKLDVPIRNLGERRLKNIAEPVRAYAIEIDSATGIPSSWRRPSRRRPAPRAWVVMAVTSLILVLIGLGAHWLGGTPASREGVSASDRGHSP
jgi:adenylate cyclase